MTRLSLQQELQASEVTLFMIRDPSSYIQADLAVSLSIVKVRHD